MGKGPAGDRGRTNSYRGLGAVAIASILLGLPVLALATDDRESVPGAGSARESGSAASRVDRFNSRRAFADLRMQVSFGERPAGSRALRTLAERLRRRLGGGRFERVGRDLRNIVATVPGRRPAILVAAHYDTAEIEGFVGAEDGAGGSAGVLEIARYFRRVRRAPEAPELRFVLFDGEECPDDSADFYTCGLRGSRAYAKRHATELGSVVVLDFIAQRDLKIKRDESSDRRLWTELRAAARRVGAESAFPASVQRTIVDDHSPFLREGVPAIDLIDFDYRCWHRTCDDLGAVSERSLDRSGETVIELLLRLGRSQ